MGRAGDELVLAGRRGGAVAAAAAGEERARRHRGGRDHVFLAVFSIAVAVGSAWRPGSRRGRIVILPTLVGAVLLGLFAIDLGWATYGIAAGARFRRRRRGVRHEPRPARGDRSRRPRHRRRPLSSCRPSAAVQAWAGADRRARVIAGVNVLNAAFMVGGTIVVAALQALEGSSTPVLLRRSALATFGVAVVIGRTMPARAGMRFPLDPVPRVLSRSR